MNRSEVCLPRLGDRMVEATVVAYRVAVHEPVAAGQVLLVVEHQGALTEIPAPISGRVEALLVNEGATVPAGTPLVRLLEPQKAKLPEAGGPPRISPQVRRLAREYGIDLHAVHGSGQEGRVTRDDVERAITVRGPAPSLAPPPPPAPEASLGALPGILVAELDLSALETFPEPDQAAARAAGVELSALPYIIRAIARALAEHPDLNATAFNHRLVRRPDRNVALLQEDAPRTASTVIHRADECPAVAISATLQAQAYRTERGTLTAQDQAGASFTVVLGTGRHWLGIASLRPPEVGVLRLGPAARRPAVRIIQGEERLVIRPLMAATLAYDARFIGPATADAFLSRVVQTLEGPFD